MKDIVLLFSIGYNPINVIANLISQDPVGRKNLIINELPSPIPLGGNIDLASNDEIQNIIEYFMENNYGTLFIVTDNLTKWNNSPYLTKLLVIEIDGVAIDITSSQYVKIATNKTKFCVTMSTVVIPGIWDNTYITGGTITSYQRSHIHYEFQYQDLIRKILNEGEMKTTRGVTTKAISGAYLTADLANGFPILTLKESWWKGIVEEFLWIISGSTDAKKLSDKKVKIWDKNTSREFLDRNGHTSYPIGDVGPGYGFQMRHAGGNYTNCEADYDCEGVDQLVNVLKTLKEDPQNRRIIINLWNVQQLKQMVLPPCHLLYQFVYQNGRLDGHLYQRSWDTSLGWNTSTLALFVHVIAHFVDLVPGIIHHYIADAHIYQEHLSDMEAVLKRIPFELPKLVIGDKPDNIDGYILPLLALENYQCHGKIKLDLVEGQ